MSNYNLAPKQTKIFCDCGMMVFKDRLRDHLLTSSHNFFTQNYIKCYICEDNHTNIFYQCKTCKQKHCFTCHNDIVQTKELKLQCPYCRDPFPYHEMRIEDVIEQEEQEHDQFFSIGCCYLPFFIFGHTE